MEGIWYLNGEYMNGEEAMISASDRGFLYGDGIFETMRIYDGQVFLEDQHLVRLFRGASFLQIPIEKEPLIYQKIIRNVIEKNNLQEGFLRLSVSRGIGKRGLLPRQCSRPAVMVTPNFLIPYKEEHYTSGFTSVIIKSTRRNPFSPLSKLKSFNYLDNILAKMESEERNADEGLLLNTFGNLTGGTVSNLFLVNNRTLYTPTVNCGILKGITRQKVIQLALEKNIPVKEKALNPNQLYQAQEVFLTNSLMEIMPLVQVEEKPIGNRQPGPVARLLRNEYIKVTKNFRYL